MNYPAVPNKTSTTTVLAASLVLTPSTASAQHIRLFTITGWNNKASDQYIMVFDAAALPADGTVTPVAVLLAPTGYQFSFNWPDGRLFANGVVVCNSSTVVSAGNITKTIGSADCIFDINYRG